MAALSPKTLSLCDNGLSGVSNGLSGTQLRQAE
jgi:hypothetical protein